MPMQTYVHIGAKDDGFTSAFKRMGGEVDAFIAKFQQLGSVMGGVLSSFSVKDAVRWVDEFDQSVFAIATTLSDTVKANDMSEVFDRNARHAEAMFRVLQKEAGRSIATVGELRRAYQVFAASGLALDPTEKSASTLSSLVSRIRLATIGQDPNLQIAQEMRALLEGRNRADSALSRIFAMRDPNYQATVKGLVARGDGAAVMDYLSSLISSVDLSGKVGSLLSVQLSQVQDSVKSWAMEAFRPFKDGVSEVMGEVSAMLSDPDSPLMKGLDKVAAAVASFAKTVFSGVKDFLSSKTGKMIAELTPQVVALTSALLGLAAAASALSLVGGAFLTVPGLAMAGYMGYQGMQAYLKGGRGNGDVLSMRDGEYDTENTVRTTCAAVVDAVDSVKVYAEAILSEAGTYWDSLMAGGEVLAGALITMASGIAEAVSSACLVAVGSVRAVVDMVDAACKAVKDAVLGVQRMAALLNAGIGRAVLFVVETGQKLFKGFSEVGDAILNGFRDFKAAVLGYVGDFFGWLSRKLADVPVLGAAFARGSGYAYAGADWLGGQKSPLEAVSGSAQGAVNGALDYVRDDLQSIIGMYRETAGDLKRRQPDSVGWLSSLSGFLRGYEDSAFQRALDGFSGKWGAIGQEIFGSGIDYYRTELARRPDLSLKTAPVARKPKQDGEGDVQAVTGERKGLDPDAAMKATGGYLKELERLYRSLGDYRADSVACESQILELTNRRLALGREFSELATGDAEKDREILSLQTSLGDAIDRQVESLQRKKAVYDVIGGLERDGDKLGAGFLSGLQKYAGEGISVMQGAEKVVQDIASGLESTFSDLFLDVLTGDLKSFGDYFAQWGQRILQIFTQVVAEMLVKWAVVKMITAAAGVFGFGSSGISGGGVSSGQPTGGQMYNPTGSVSGPTGMANGGIFRGGFRAFANGGVVTGPTLGLVGEGRYDEAIVPMPDGHAIPVVVQEGFKAFAPLPDGRSIPVSLQGFVSSPVPSVSGTFASGRTPSAAGTFASEPVPSVSGTFASGQTPSAAGTFASGQTPSVAGNFARESAPSVAGNFARESAPSAAGSFARESAPSVAGNFARESAPSVVEGLGEWILRKLGFRAFANGGVVTGPTIGLVGEGRYSEAVVPLPDGRSIPVAMQGGAASVVVNINDNSGLDIRKTVNSRQDEDGQTVIDVILDAVQRNRGGFASRMRGALGLTPA